MLSDKVLTPEMVPSLKRLTDAVHAAGAKIAVQLTHAGAFADRAVTGEQQVGDMNHNPRTTTTYTALLDYLT